MAVQLKPEQEQRLQRLAAEQGATPEHILEDVVDRYLKYVEELTAAVREGEESAARDGWLSHEEVFERLNPRVLKPA